VRDYYQNEKFYVITPYDDVQRNLIQETLKSESLPFDNVYNVDSFQGLPLLFVSDPRPHITYRMILFKGNEADHILLSIVRIDKPGFLTSQNRVNVIIENPP
jgi:superfamily I DNA and/or RNA helicase